MNHMGQQIWNLWQKVEPALWVPEHFPGLRDPAGPYFLIVIVHVLVLPNHLIRTVFYKKLRTVFIFSVKKRKRTDFF